MSPAVVAIVETMLEKWKDREGKEIEMFGEFRLLTSEVISRTAFGSNYLKGKQIFAMLNNLSILLNRNAFKTRIPFINKVWKTADLIESYRLEKGIQECVMSMVKKREDKVVNGEADNFGNDFLGLLISTIINESLRLYGPTNGLPREIRREVQLGKLVLPANINLLVQNIALHYDPHLWGDDAHLFKPERFAEGIAKATNYNAAAYFPFGLGPRFVSVWPLQPQKPRLLSP
ncbi:hypothetical protein V6N11_061072 [Hibiscus sabdariffa]|uniref:Cytochrome P450 n=1 Tax=Hibiscus sabdariffa TaxID=183260 RepID=A0ABR2QS63_9ROSI